MMKGAFNRCNIVDVGVVVSQINLPYYHKLSESTDVSYNLVFIVVPFHLCITVLKLSRIVYNLVIYPDASKQTSKSNCI